MRQIFQTQEIKTFSAVQIIAYLLWQLLLLLFLETPLGQQVAVLDCLWQFLTSGLREGQTSDGREKSQNDHQG